MSDVAHSESEASFGVSPSGVFNDSFQPSTSELLKAFKDRLAELVEMMQHLDESQRLRVKDALDGVVEHLDQSCQRLHVKEALDGVVERLDQSSAR